LLRKLRELEEQMQSDDRVERLENSLKNMQDRADELEFQLSKLKPVNTFIYYFHYCVSCD
jgi:predicted RNase H-like nuclease (RuvC/YqgF family)